MKASPLVTIQDVLTHLDDPAWAVVDCRFSLRDPTQGREAYHTAHIPGAVYADLDTDLSGPVVPGVTGRHPLPVVAAAASTFGRWGIADGVQVVAYDDAGGAIAARLWWMLGWLGHDAVAVLDGGFAAWTQAGHPTRNGVEGRAPRTFTAHPRTRWVVDVADVDRDRLDAGARILDARAADRFRGEHETIDPVAGHIPGAVSFPYTDNLDPAGRFRPPAQIARRWDEVLGPVPLSRASVYCGSGVTAAHLALSAAVAGLAPPAVFPGSWSEWITDPNRPVAQGAGVGSSEDQ